MVEIRSAGMFICMLIAIAVASCGADSGIVTKHPTFKATPPDSPGSLEGLQASVWEYRGGYYEFGPDGELHVDVLGQEQSGEYTFENGVVELKLPGGTTLNATWDGNDLVIEGRSAIPVESG